MDIYTIPVTAFQQNCRLLCLANERKGVIIDPGGEVESILKVVDELELEIDMILLTHAHLDHAGGVAKLQSLLERRQGRLAEFYAHRAEQGMRSQVAMQSNIYGMGSSFENCPEPDHYVDEGDVIKFGNVSLEVRFTPGHSPGHVVFFINQNTDEYRLHDSGTTFKVSKDTPMLIAGDTLFKGSIGRTDLPGGNHDQLINSITTRIFSLPDETIVLSGHGPNTVVGKEKRSNPFFVN